MNFGFFGETSGATRSEPPAFPDFRSGTRDDVAKVLESFGTLTHKKAVSMLAHAWYADAILLREQTSAQRNVTQREVESLVQGLCVPIGSQSSNVNARILASLYLAGELRVAQAAGALLRHPRSTVREGAARICDSFYDPRSLEHLVTIVASDPLEAVRASVKTICRLGDEQHLPLIEEALVHPDEYVCAHAIAGVKRLRPPLAPLLLEEAARRGRPLTCVTALTALGELGDLAHMPRLMAALNSASSFQRIGAARGLAALAVARPEGNFTPALEALQKRARLGGAEYRRSLAIIRQAVGINPELPIPAEGSGLRPETLPIPDSLGEFALFELPQPGPLPDDEEEDESDFLTRGLRNALPRPEDWEYDS